MCFRVVMILCRRRVHRARSNPHRGSREHSAHGNRRYLKVLSSFFKQVRELV
jgi:hypothetical protein